MENNIRISIIYVYYNTPKEITESIKSVSIATNNNYEIIIINNNSPKKLEVKKIEENIRVINNDKNFGFGYACNQGAKFAKGNYLLFINPDTIFSKGSIDILLKAFSESRNVGIVGPKMIDANGKVLPTINSKIKFPHAIVIYSFLNKILKNNRIVEKFWLKKVDRSKTQKVDVVSGACMMIEKKLFEKIGGFDERFFLYFEEQDLCLRVAKKGYKVIFHPSSEITHFIGRSLSNKEKIEKYFQKSRYLYMKKYFGVIPAMLTEISLRVLVAKNLLLILLFLLSLFLNTYKQNELMLFIGDAARDFIAARDMILTGEIPLVGIPSSAAWLHQGPISIYLIAVAFLVSNFNPIAPAIFFGLIGAITTMLVYFLGKVYFNEKVGILSAFFYATAPMIVVNARMPYHTSLIPFFAAIFLLLLHKTIATKRINPILFFCYGILLLVELSNIIVIVLCLILFYIYRLRMSKGVFIQSIIMFFLGIIPFIIYDFLNGPAYLKFPLWIGNRVLRFFGIYLYESDHIINYGLHPNFYQQITDSIFPNMPIVAFSIFIFLLIVLLRKIGQNDSSKSSSTVFLWIIIPIVAFILHGAPGMAYFTLIYPAIAIGIGVLFYGLQKKSKLLIFIFFAILSVNSGFLIKNSFYETTEKGSHPMPNSKYNFGYSWSLSDAVAKAIVINAKGKEFVLQGGGGVTTFKTSIDPYRFLIWKRGGREVLNAPLKYVIYQNIDEVPNKDNLIHKSIGGYVVKYE